MPTPERIKLASLEKRSRVCQICGVQFVVRSADRKGVACSKDCLRECNRRAQLGKTQAPETIAKRRASIAAYRAANPDLDAARQSKCAEKLKAYTQTDAFARASSERMKLRHTDPEWQAIRDARSSRVMKETWLKQRARMVQNCLDRSVREMAEGVGIFSADSEARKRQAAKWIMTQARQALESETDFIATWSRVMARLRAEHPYLGEVDCADYYEYLRLLGKATAEDIEVRTLCDTFMAGAIPRFSAEWRERKHSLVTATPTGAAA